MLNVTAATPGEPIMEQPAGTETEIDLFYSGFYYGLSGLEYVEDQVLTTKMVTDDEGNVYFQNLFAFAPGGYWIKGKMETETTIEVQLPQTISLSDHDKYGKSWQDLNVFHTEDIDNVVPEPVQKPEDNRLVFSIDKDGAINMPPFKDGYSLGLTDYSTDFPDGMWMGFSITWMAMEKSTGLYSYVTPPEGLVTKRYSYITQGMGVNPEDPKDFGYRMAFGFDGDDAYIGGISLDIPGAWIKGHREGNRVILPNNQPMGSAAGAYRVMLQFCKKDPVAYGGYSLLPADAEFVFLYDEATDTYTTEDKDVIILVNAGGTDKIYFLQMITDPTLVYQPEAKGVPMDPWGMRFFPREKTGDNFDTLDFNLPMVTAEGVLLERENMFYRLFIDGDHFEILSEEFDSDQDMWDIPYNYDMFLIVCNRMNTAHEMGIRIAGYETVGIQSVNVWDGVEYTSNIVEISTSGVDQIEADRAPESVEYFTLDGLRVGDNARGLVLKRTRYTDGTVGFSKHMAR